MGLDGGMDGNAPTYRVDLIKLFTKHLEPGGTFMSVVVKVSSRDRTFLYIAGRRDAEEEREPGTKGWKRDVRCFLFDFISKMGL